MTVAGEPEFMGERAQLHVLGCDALKCISQPELVAILMQAEARRASEHAREVELGREERPREESERQTVREVSAQQLLRRLDEVVTIRRGRGAGGRRLDSMDCE